MDGTLRELRQVLGRGPAGRRGFPVEVRRRAAAWARRQQAAGEPMRGVAAQLGISHETLRRWLEHGESTFRRVHVGERRMSAPTTGGAVLRLPSGVAVEGLSVEGVVAVLRALS